MSYKGSRIFALKGPKKKSPIRPSKKCSYRNLKNKVLKSQKTKCPIGAFVELLLIGGRAERLLKELL